MSYASGYFKTTYAQAMNLVETRTRWACLVLFFGFLVLYPFIASPFWLDLASQVCLALIGALALMLLTGYAGLISLGHAGLIAAGAFTSAILFKELNAPIFVTLPASGIVGALLGVIFGLPSLRLKGVYLALSTLALHFIVTYAGSEYESSRGYATGVLMDPPRLGSLTLDDPRLWYYVLLLAAFIVLLLTVNLVRSRTGRAWMAIRARDVAAEAFGINVAYYKVLAFVVSSALTSMAGCLFAYYHGFVSVEAFSILMTIEYVAMVIIGGLGSIIGAVFGTVFIVLLPYIIDEVADTLAVPDRLSTYLFALNYASFGLIMIIFLVFEPRGLVGIWNRIQNYFILWPFRHRK
jgi:branched-chain amino acid transport system permease protein